MGGERMIDDAAKSSYSRRNHRGRQPIIAGGSRGASTKADAEWPYGHQQDNPTCGGYPIWGGPKEGPNGMGRNSPGNMWVR